MPSHRLMNPMDPECSPCRNDCPACAQETVARMRRDMPEKPSLPEVAKKLVASYGEIRPYDLPHAKFSEYPRVRELIKMLGEVLDRESAECWACIREKEGMMLEEQAHVCSRGTKKPAVFDNCWGEKDFDPTQARPFEIPKTLTLPSIQGGWPELKPIADAILSDSVKAPYEGPALEFVVEKKDRHPLLDLFEFARSEALHGHNEFPSIEERLRLIRILALADEEIRKLRGEPWAASEEASPQEIQRRYAEEQLQAEQRRRLNASASLLGLAYRFTNMANTLKSPEMLTMARQVEDFAKSLEKKG